MNPIAEILLEQVFWAQKRGRQILAMSGLDLEGVIYAFATPESLIINCENCETAWRFDEEQSRLYQAIAQANLSIKTIWIEKAGQCFYHW